MKTLAITFSFCIFLKWQENRLEDESSGVDKKEDIQTVSKFFPYNMQIISKETIIALDQKTLPYSTFIKTLKSTS